MTSSRMSTETHQMVKNDWAILDRWWPERDTWSQSKYGMFLLSLFLLLGALPYALINRFSAWRGTNTYLSLIHI